MTDIDDNNAENIILSDDRGNATIYGIGVEAIKRYVVVYLNLSKQTGGFERLDKDYPLSLDEKRVILAGFGSNLPPEKATNDQVSEELIRQSSTTFDIERSITTGVYIELRQKLAEMFDELKNNTKDFSTFNAEYIVSHPQMLPIFQRLLGVASKAELKRKFKTASDGKISKKSSQLIAEELNKTSEHINRNKTFILNSIEPTLEGIVRDLAGRYALEGIVEQALIDNRIIYSKESENKKIKGVVYDHRADFTIFDGDDPIVFIEVRKSSSRHASLYSKDKMFSAINWKGKNKELLAVIITDGPWIEETLRVMAKVFDYVTPIRKSLDVAESIAAYVNGDKSKLKYVINFSIDQIN